MDENCYTEQVPVTFLDQKSRIILVRNGEPCDRLMPAWAHKAFHDVDKYNLLDLNQPYTIVNRTASSLSINSLEQAADLFKNDAPLTQIGRMCAKRVGAAFHQRNVRFQIVFCSPAIRCVETANAIVSQFPTHGSIKIVVEPGLLDPLVLYKKEKNGLPKFLTPSHYNDNGLTVDTKYIPAFTMEQLRSLKEDPADFRSRIERVIQMISSHSKKTDSSALIVTHAPTIDMLTRLLIGRKDMPKTKYDFNRMGLSYPFCSVTTVERVEYDEEKATSKWALKRHVIPSMTIGHLSTTAHIPNF